MKTGIHLLSESPLIFSLSCKNIRWFLHFCITLSAFGKAYRWH